MRAIAIATLALATAGCAKEPEVVTVVTDPQRPALPAECTMADQAWRNLPDADVPRSEAARNYASNKNQYRTISSRRSICRAAINASNKG